MRVRWQLQIDVETASFVTLRSLPGEPECDGNPVSCFFPSPPGRPSLALAGIAEISLPRSEQNCRRLSRNPESQVLELMLCSNSRQRELRPLPTRKVRLGDPAILRCTRR